MSTPSNAIPDAAPAREMVATPAIPLSRQIYWAVRRELWESRSIWISPLVAAAAALAGFLVNVIRLPEKMRATASAHSMAAMHGAVEVPFDFAAGLLMVTTLIVAVVYSMDALYGERRDRSILFWKSMPVSDLMTVVAKASIPIVILPLITFVTTFVLHVIMALIGSAIVAASGLSVAAYWDALAFGRMELLLFYHLIAVHGLAWAPAFGWLLLVSAWARRVPYLWAILPPVALGIVEHIAFGTSKLTEILMKQTSGAMTVESLSHRSMPMDPMTTHATPGAFFASPGLWIGLVLTAVFIAAAARVRRAQSPN